MKKIMIICNYFAPNNKIAAVRITKIAKFLHEYGYKVIVVTEQRNDAIEDDILRDDAEGIDVIKVENSKRMKQVISFCKKGIILLRRNKYDNLENRVRINHRTGNYEFYPFQTAYPLISSLEYGIELIRQYNLFRTSRKVLNRHEDMDYIFTSYGDMFGIYMGAYLHKKFKKTPWIVDIRDPICSYKFTPQYMRWIAKIIEEYVWREADSIIAVSKGICQRVPRKCWKKLHCVRNGYDRKDREGILVDANRCHKLRLTYTGAMHGGLQNVSPVFYNVRRLVDKGKVDVSKIEFYFAGTESAYKVFISQAQRHGLQDRCIYFGKVTRREALKLQMDSDILLVSSFDYQTNIEGIITGKALEYMSANKPIIAIINGDIENSELGNIIRSANLGFVYEEAHYKIDNSALYQYLLSSYDEFLQKGTITHKPNKRILEKFDYQYLGEKIKKIIENTER